MSALDKATETQLKNIQARTGKTLDELRTIVEQSGLEKHSEIRAMLQRDLDIGYGDANTLVHVLRQSDGASAAKASGATTEDVVSDIYAGSKAGLRPIHEQLMAAIEQFGPFEIAPKKGYISLRRKKQFAMIGPVTNARVEVGLNMKGVDATERLAAMPAGGMCNYKVKVADPAEIDAELIEWVRHAYASAG
jgi:hypothetical protein